MSTKKVLCKYYQQGACQKGSSCPFSHDRNSARPDNVCKFYLQGSCSYGDRCRYDHVKQRKQSNQSTATTTRNSRSNVSTKKTGSSKTSNPWGKQRPSKPLSSKATPKSSSTSSTPSRPFSDHISPSSSTEKHRIQPTSLPPKSTIKKMALLSTDGVVGKEVFVCDNGDDSPVVLNADAPEFIPRQQPQQQQEQQEFPVMQQQSFLSYNSNNSMFNPFAMNTFPDIGGGLANWQSNMNDYSMAVKVADGEGLDKRHLPLCPIGALVGVCEIENCPFIHGNVCPSCQLMVLHPFRDNEHNPHIEECISKRAEEEKRAQLEQVSKGIECCICMEIVKEKSVASERRFGLLPNCNHSFCLQCIRKWRSQDGQGKIVQHCPMCRVQSFFVIPSSVWVEDEGEKQKIMNEYKAEMKAIDCQHFNFGAGDCPFGSKCFYRHVTRDGKEDTLQGRPRYLIGADGEAERMQTVRISDFFVEREKRAFKHEYGEDGIIFED
eukprot:m.148013 g.148013  ORF g.148013 m.148013 type:complete len:492 (-) comp13247_c3_seq3:1073-2548(-)